VPTSSAPATARPSPAPESPKAEATPGKTPEPGQPGASQPSAAANPAAAAAAKKALDAEKEKARQAAAEAVPVEVSPVIRGPISAFLSFNSTLETEAMVDIFPQASGQVEELHAEEGKLVKAGDPLLKIEDRELRVDAEETQANYDHELLAFSRNEDLFKRNLITKQEFDDKRFQLEQIRLRLERAKLKLSYATVRAPFDGVIASREAQVGARVGSGAKVFSMVKLDEIVARVFVPGRYLPVVALNQAAVVSAEVLSNKTFTGWVKRISPVIDPKSGTFKVTIGVKGEKPNDLPPGLFVSVRVITDTRPAAVLIPKRALVYEGGERFVYTIVKDKAVKRKIAVGYEDPQNVEALSGFELGTPVIVLGQATLKDGAAVRIVNAPVAAATGPAPAGDSPVRTARASALTSRVFFHEHRSEKFPAGRIALCVHGQTPGLNPHGRAGGGRVRLGLLPAARADVDAEHELSHAHRADRLSRHRAGGNGDRGLAAAGATTRHHSEARIAQLDFEGGPVRRHPRVPVENGHEPRGAGRAREDRPAKTARWHGAAAAAALRSVAGSNPAPGARGPAVTLRAALPG
jgi:membrane fusion protein (multidrug efflux system)